MKKFVYSFNEGSKDMKDLLGGKGANLAEMTKIKKKDQNRRGGRS